MHKLDLAKQLRHRQLKLGTVPPALIHSLTDEAVIDSYITCSCCQKREVTAEELAPIIAKAANAGNFFELLDARGGLRGVHVRSAN